MKSLSVLALFLVVGCSTPKRGDLIGDPFTFVGIPRVLSEGTFRNIDGLQRGLLVEVLRVTKGKLDDRQIEFPIPADQPSPLKIGAKYLITAGSARHGLVILDYHEVK